jgi:hypothetical protein
MLEIQDENYYQGSLSYKKNKSKIDELMIIFDVP